jgi:heptosyltransferase-2
MTCKTVVIGLNWVGDNILALPTFRALQHRFRHDGGVAVAVPQNVATLFAASGTFKKVISWNGSTRERIRVLRGEEFERAIILPNSFRAAVVALAARIPERWGYSTDGRRLLLTNAVAKPGDRRHQLDDYTPLLAALNAPRPAAVRRPRRRPVRPRQALGRHALHGNRRAPPRRGLRRPAADQSR